MLIQAQQLQEELSNINLCIFDCRFAMSGPDFDPNYGREQYHQNHIPGAQYVDLEQDLSREVTPQTGRHPFPNDNIFLDKLQKWGLSPEKKVVVYDDKGGVIAARLWWMLRYWVDHKDVHLLDGGFTSWQQAKMPITSEAPAVQTSSHRYTTTQQYLRSTTEVRANIEEKKDIVVDARARPRFMGEQENVDPIAGHIPQALNLPCMENLDAFGKFLKPEQLKSRFSHLLETVGEQGKIIHSCGSGVTACHNIFAMDLAEIHASLLYAGSWSEWIQNPDNPIAVGE